MIGNLTEGASVSGLEPVNLDFFGGDVDHAHALAGQIPQDFGE